MTLSLALLLHTAMCWFMTGVIWIVQLLVYPNFLLLSEPQFAKHHSFHTERISWVVIPAMLTELGTALWLYFFGVNLFYAANLITLAATWAVTGLVSVPLHNRLAKNDFLAAKTLIFTNWARTLLWSLRSLALLWLLLNSDVLRRL